MLRHINYNNLLMSILFCNFVTENKMKTFFDILKHRHHRWTMANTYRY